MVEKGKTTPRSEAASRAWTGWLGRFMCGCDRREGKLSNDPVRMTADEIAQKKREREDLLARLVDVTEQRDKLLSQYESMAFQVDESVRDVDGALLEAQRNAERAEACERLEQQEAAQINELRRQLDEERRKSGEVASEFSRYRESVEQKLAEHARREDPWSLLAFAITQILCQWVAWLRAKIPSESALLPWFDRAVEFLQASGRLAWTSGKAFYEWAKPHVVDLWKRLRSEASRIVSKE